MKNKMKSSCTKNRTLDANEKWKITQNILVFSKWVRLTGSLAQEYLYTVIWAYMYDSACMMHNCVIYSSRYHNFVSTHNQNTN